VSRGLQLAITYVCEKNLRSFVYDENFKNLRNLSKLSMMVVKLSYNLQASLSMPYVILEFYPLLILDISSLIC
jgi:hypothetical protein